MSFTVGKIRLFQDVYPSGKEKNEQAYVALYM